MKKKPIKKAKSISKLKKIADAVFSKWVRNRERACVTCGGRENLQCGHFVSRGHNNTRFDPDNCHTQDARCNIFLNGNYPAYAEFLERKYGHGIIQELQRRGRILKQFKRSELEAIIQKYSLKTN